MAYIRAIGMQQPVELDAEFAREIKRKWLEPERYGTLPDVIDLRITTIRKQDLRGIDLPEDQTNILPFNLDDENDRFVIREFENELRGRDFEKYCLDRKFIFYPHTVNADTVREYEDAQRKWRGLEDLRNRRWKAKQYEHRAETAVAGVECGCREYCKPKLFSEWMAEQGRIQPIKKMKKVKK